MKYLQEVLAEAYKTKEHQAFIKRKNLDIVESFRSAADSKKVMMSAIKDYAEIFKKMGKKVRPGL